ncbi:MAG: gluconate 2-dehydrogenase subunit 3 family protein [Chloroflexi bacterium]|nr:gluconate 2-dehydrogenase subunit 3 family protein [Chloroflexota bacterium]
MAEQRRDPHERRPFLSDSQRALLSAVLDRIVPASGDLPGAGSLGVDAHVDGMAGLDAGSRRLMTDGLRAIEIAGSRTDRGGFADLPESDKTSVLKQIESDRPEFFKMLVQQAYAGYYTDRRVLRAKGLSEVPPQPDGHEMPPFDESLLDGVRRRGKAYRDAQ